MSDFVPAAENFAEKSLFPLLHSNTFERKQTWREALAQRSLQHSFDLTLYLVFRRTFVRCMGYDWWLGHVRIYP